MKFSEMKYERPDKEALKTQMEELTTRLKEAKSADEARQAFLDMDKVGRHVSTLQELALMAAEG